MEFFCDGIPQIHLSNLRILGIAIFQNLKNIAGCHRVLWTGKSHEQANTTVIAVMKSP